MSIKARFILGRRGFSEEAFMALHKLAMSHPDKRGGQHTNGGCREGRCDYGSPACAAWTAVCQAVIEMDRELERAAAPQLLDHLQRWHVAAHPRGDDSCETCQFLRSKGQPITTPGDGRR